MADQRLRTKRELKHLFTNLRKKGITDEMISILIDTLWRDRVNSRTSGFRIRGGNDAVISIDPVTRIFTIKPFDPEDENYDPRYGIFVWSNLAVLHRIYDTKTIEIPNEEGLYCIYFDKEPDPGTAQVLTLIKNPTAAEIDSIIETKVVISFLYWDANAQEALHFGDDRHGSEWNPQIHRYLHQAFGARRKSGLQFSDYIADGDGSLNDHAKFSITGGVMLHDDFELAITGAGPGLPILYAFGGLPRFVANGGYAVYRTSGRLCFNSGLNTINQCADENFVLYHIFATNEILTTSRKIISVMGTHEYTTAGDAFKGLDNELDEIATYMPQQGRCYLGSVLFQTSDAYANDIHSRLVVLVNREMHPPVTIQKESKPYLFITEKQELRIDVDALSGGWNIHSPEQIIGYLPEPENIAVTVNGVGTVDYSVAAGEIVVTAINANGETMPVNVPAFDVLVDSTTALISWDEITGATGYRVYNTLTGFYMETENYQIDYITFNPTVEAEPPSENSAAIFQFPFTIDNGDTVEIKGLGIDVETEVDETDSTIKRILLKKQQSSWSITDESSPNFIPGKPTLSNGEDGREVELSTSGGYIVWRYSGDEDWINLVELASLIGPPGDDGAPGDDGREVELRENAGWVEWRYVGDASWTQLYEIPEGGGGTGVIQATGTLVVANWVTDGSLKKYVLSNANITATSSVEVIPANASYDVLVAAEPMPETESAEGTVTIWAKNTPSADIPVTINITEIV